MLMLILLRLTLRLCFCLCLCHNYEPAYRVSVAEIARTPRVLVIDLLKFLRNARILCSQAAEKALKAAQYAIDADRMNVHNLVQICCDLNDCRLTQLASELENLVGSSTRMRYPDMMSFPQIPNDVYTAQMAHGALQLAKKIVEGVRNRIT